MPGAEELASAFRDPFSGILYLGNPELKPEESRTIEWGLDLGYGGWDVSFSNFFTDFKNRIVTVPGAAAGTSTYDNLGEVTINGIETTASFDFGRQFGWGFRLQPYFSLVYHFKFEDEETGEDLFYISNALFSCGINFSGYKGITSNLNIAYTGKQRIDDWVSGIFPAPAADKGGFTVVNFTIDKEILDFDKYGKFTLKGQVQNLLNHSYSYQYGYPMPGRTFFLGLRYDY
jgi:vitamin B12 transporter